MSDVKPKIEVFHSGQYSRRDYHLAPGLFKASEISFNPLTSAELDDRSEKLEKIGVAAKTLIEKIIALPVSGIKEIFIKDDHTLCLSKRDKSAWSDIEPNLIAALMSSFGIRADMVEVSRA